LHGAVVANSFQQWLVEFLFEPVEVVNECADVDALRGGGLAEGAMLAGVGESVQALPCAGLDFSWEWRSRSLDHDRLFLIKVSCLWPW
jgi:hypothetical protein